MGRGASVLDRLEQRELTRLARRLLSLGRWFPPLIRAERGAKSFTADALDLDGPPAFLDPPELPGPTLAWGSW